jgi:hypothetical protein
MDSMQRDLQDLSAAIRNEIRLEAEEAEREAAAAAALRRDLADVARELMARGDTVAVDAGQRVFAGEIVGVGSDLLTVDAGASRVDVNLACVVRLQVLSRARSGGRRSSGEAASFRARLMELQLSGQPTEVGTSGNDDEIAGPVALVGRDHVAIGEGVGPEWFLPLHSLAYVRTRDLAGEEY